MNDQLHPKSTRVKFTGYQAASHDYPNIKIGESGEIVSIKANGQIGMDYLVDFGGGRKFMLNHNEVELDTMNEITTNALLPCPCCGGNALQRYTPDMKHMRILCKVCGVGTIARPLDSKDKMYADWNRRPSSPAKPNHDLHREIMNIPSKNPFQANLHGAAYTGYLDGHKDARHAAAELALQSSPAPEDKPAGYVRCPICNEPDMLLTREKHEGLPLIDCCNHACRSNVPDGSGYDHKASLSPAPVNAKELRKEALNIYAHQDYHDYKAVEVVVDFLIGKMGQSPAPVNTQGGGLRDALEKIVEIPDSFDGGDWDEIGQAREIARAALAQAEQEQPAPSIGLSFHDAIEAIQDQAKGVRVGLTLRAVLGEVDGSGAPMETKVEVVAWADTKGGPIAAAAYSLPGILGAMTHELNKRQ